MFESCSNLTTGPELNASTLVSGCYCRMFANCLKLTNLTCTATDNSASYCLGNWLENIKTSGTLHCKNGYAGIWSGEVPSSWTVVDDK